MISSKPAADAAEMCAADNHSQSRSLQQRSCIKLVHCHRLSRKVSLMLASFLVPPKFLPTFDSARPTSHVEGEGAIAIENMFSGVPVATVAIDAESTLDILMQHVHRKLSLQSGFVAPKSTAHEVRLFRASDGLELTKGVGGGAGDPSVPLAKLGIKDGDVVQVAIPRWYGALPLLRIANDENADSTMFHACSAAANNATVAVMSDFKALLFDVDCGRQVGVINRPSADCRCCAVALAPDGDRLYMSYLDKSCGSVVGVRAILTSNSVCWTLTMRARDLCDMLRQVFDVASGQLISEFTTPNLFSLIAPNPSGTLIHFSWMGIPAVYDATTFKVVWEPHHEQAAGSSYHAQCWVDDHRFVQIQDGTAQIEHVSSIRSQQRVFPNEFDDECMLAVAQVNGHYVVTVTGKCRVKVWDHTTMRVVVILAPYMHECRFINWIAVTSDSLLVCDVKRLTRWSLNGTVISKIALDNDMNPETMHVLCDETRVVSVMDPQSRRDEQQLCVVGV